MQQRTYFLKKICLEKEKLIFTKSFPKCENVSSKPWHLVHVDCFVFKGGRTANKFRKSQIRKFADLS
jgi:hypothetical protein